MSVVCSDAYSWTCGLTSNRPAIARISSILEPCALIFDATTSNKGNRDRYIYVYMYTQTRMRASRQTCTCAHTNARTWYIRIKHSNFIHILTLMDLYTNYFRSFTQVYTSVCIHMGVYEVRGTLLGSLL